MPISLAQDVARPKLVQTVAVPVSVTVANPTEADGSDSFTQYITLNAIEPATQTVSCTGVDGQATLTAAAGHDIRVGDVAAGSGVASGAIVTTVAGNTITLDNANTGTVNGSITFNPPTTNARIFGIQGNFTVSGTKLLLTLKVYAPNGSKVTGPSDETVVADMGSPVLDSRVSTDIDTFLLGARVPKTNS